MGCEWRADWESVQRDSLVLRVSDTTTTAYAYSPTGGLSGLWHPQWHVNVPPTPPPVSPGELHSEQSSINYDLSARQQEIATENSQCSPLLRLPPEIRNRIYEAVLGDRLIHVSVRNCRSDEPGAIRYDQYYRPGLSPVPVDSLLTLKITHSICTLPRGDDEAARELSDQPIVLPDDDHFPEDYAVRHAPCYRGLARIKHQATNSFAIDHGTCTRYPPLCLTLLRTCRQIYNETSLLPYSSNTFTFHESGTFNQFITHTLTAPQKSALTTIHIDGHHEFSANLPRISRCAALCATGLRTLIFFSSGSWETPKGSWSAEKRVQLNLAPILDFTRLHDVTFKAVVTPKACSYNPVPLNRLQRRQLAVVWENLLRTESERRADDNGKGKGKKRKVDDDEDEDEDGRWASTRGAELVIFPKPPGMRAIRIPPREVLARGMGSRS